MAQSTGSRIEANLPEDRCFLNYTNYVSSTRPSRYTMTFQDAFFLEPIAGKMLAAPLRRICVVQPLIGPAFLSCSSLPRI